MLLGLRTTIYAVRDLAAAKAWFTGVAGHPPYFDQPFYVGFNVGGYELGLLPYEDAEGATEATTYWGVADIAAEVNRIAAAGAKVVIAANDVGDNIKVAVLADPFGNHIGLIENPHFTLG
jgi:predicted enzyme related to lactoylglutathione lyase